MCVCVCVCVPKILPFLFLGLDKRICEDRAYGSAGANGNGSARWRPPLDNFDRTPTLSLSLSLSLSASSPSFSLYSAPFVCLTLVVALSFSFSGTFQLSLLPCIIHHHRITFWIQSILWPLMPSKLRPLTPEERGEKKNLQRVLPCEFTMGAHGSSLERDWISQTSFSKFSFVGLGIFGAGKPPAFLLKSAGVFSFCFLSFRRTESASHRSTREILKRKGNFINATRSTGVAVRRGCTSWVVEVIKGSLVKTVNNSVGNLRITRRPWRRWWLVSPAREHARTVPQWWNSLGRKVEELGNWRRRLLVDFKEIPDTLMPSDFYDFILIIRERNRNVDHQFWRNLT